MIHLIAMGTISGLYITPDRAKMSCSLAIEIYMFCKKRQLYFMILDRRGRAYAPRMEIWIGGGGEVGGEAGGFDQKREAEEDKFEINKKCEKWSLYGMKEVDFMGWVKRAR